MRELTAQELDCLKRIAAGPAGNAAPCAEHLLNNLLALGLIEQAPRILLPVPLFRTSYRLTGTGETALWSGGGHPDR